MSSNAGPGWVKSSYSSNGNQCVEVNVGSATVVGVRDTKQEGAGPELWVPAASAAAFVAGVVNGTLSA
ncbi:DUF397 domain-containing protein [Streptomyces marincola]|uniref:DUF397 domain-containing protein n=1 Tax=Streptomyces marincola TaxID=2878388 RepID=UPI001CF3F548|nr:DUF397 domain-containing protein [Streptomyces marincola]UCM89431.1 DUF397 domain-containing protein [Streptomyces marincola]